MLASACAPAPADLAAEAAPLSDATVETLVREQLPLVGHLVREALTRVPAHVGRDDLISAGMYALVASAKSFDAERGVPFSRFAAIRIRGAITDELRSRDWASRSVRGKAREVEEVRNTLAATLGRSPSRDEIARTLGVAPRDVDAIEADVHRAAVLSLQSLTPEDSDDLVPSAGEQPEDLLIRREQLGYLRDAIAELPERLRIVLTGHFFEQRRMVDIAAELGVTESRVSQMRSEALSMLRAAMSSAAGDSDERPTDGAAVRGRAASRAAYCAAVATRSTLTDRLAATTTLGEVRPPAARLRVAN